MRRRLATALALVATALVTGCGGSTSTGVSGDPGAALIRSDALAYVALDSDLGSDQWQKADELLRKFPGREKLIAELRQELAGEQLDYDRDIEPALGPEVDIAVAPGATPTNVSYVWLTKPDSMEKARALVAKLNASDSGPDATASRVVEGWLVVSKSERILDATLKGSADKSLADDTTFENAMAELPEDALVKAYVNGRQLAELVGAAMGGGAQTAAAGDGTLAPFGLDKLEWISASVEAKDDGVGFDGAVKGAGAGRLVNAGEPYASKLVSGVPADALAFATFQGRTYGEQLSDLRQNPMFSQAFDEIEKQLGMRLDEVLGLLSKEVAVYVRPGPGIPEISVVLETPDTEQALTTLDRLANRVAALVHGRISQETQDGVTVKSLAVPPVTVRWAGFDGRVLLTTAPTGISDYRAAGEKLSDDSRYKAALEAAGAPDKTAGLLYVNLDASVQLIENYIGVESRVPPDVRENLRPLESFAAYSTSNGDLTKLAAFLGIK